MNTLRKYNTPETNIIEIALTSDMMIGVGGSGDEQLSRGTQSYDEADSSSSNNFWDEE